MTTEFETPDAPAQDVGNQAGIDVLRERHRQVHAEGFAHDYDDRYTRGELGFAAICYVWGDMNLTLWPFSVRWWKPGDRRRNLVKAGALILAEIERLDRAAARDAVHAAPLAASDAP